MLDRARHLFHRAYGVPSKIDEILATVTGLAPAKAKDLPVGMTPDDQNPFWHWQSSFDAVGTMRKYAATGLKPSPDYLINYLGVKIDPAFFPAILGGEQVPGQYRWPGQGEVEPMPEPNNWHADIAEFAAALRAVELSKGSFTVVELGCGWGCWLNNTGVAARRVGKRVFLIGIEGDEGHLGFARKSLPENGFAESEYALYHGIAAAYNGVALFPRQDVAGRKWGLEPILNPTDEQVQQATEDGSCQILPTLDLQTIVDKHGDLDLLHIDIQGGETALLEACVATCNEHVRFVLVGTHGRVVEGKLETLMFSNGWVLEMDRPSISSLDDGVQTLRVDGVQGWRNPRMS